ncbi:hypothetical protein X566_01305 [Afipia sp. P52-10]|nr:hypothetical protein [Afipia sp. P52-10]ETR79308.1 hypothetical protein X566_01305 [Afipia sp. P52-10]
MYDIDFGWLPWIFGLAVIGIIALLGAAGFGLWWIVSHLQWVS